MQGSCSFATHCALPSNAGKCLVTWQMENAQKASDARSSQMAARRIRFLTLLSTKISDWNSRARASCVRGRSGIDWRLGRGEGRPRFVGKERCQAEAAAAFVGNEGSSSGRGSLFYTSEKENNPMQKCLSFYLFPTCSHTSSLRSPSISW